MIFAPVTTLIGIAILVTGCSPECNEKEMKNPMNTDALRFTERWTKDRALPQVDETKAADYVGKVVLIGVTYEDSKGRITGRRQWAGIIQTYSNKQGIRVALFDSKEFCALPPDPDAIRPANPGVYRLKETGREIKNPDYLATWICSAPDPCNEPTGP